MPQAGRDSFSSRSTPFSSAGTGFAPRYPTGGRLGFTPLRGTIPPISERAGIKGDRLALALIPPSPHTFARR